jgi:hypothetical protein
MLSSVDDSTRPWRQGIKVYMYVLLKAVFQASQQSVQLTSTYEGKGAYSQSGWPDEFVKKMAQNVVQPIFVKISA